MPHRRARGTTGCDRSRPSGLHAHYLGDVQAPDEKAAEAAAVVEFKLTDDQRKRVVVQERE
jgi:hypothetical protein